MTRPLRASTVVPTGTCSPVRSSLNDFDFGVLMRIVPRARSRFAVFLIFGAGNGLSLATTVHVFASFSAMATAPVALQEPPYVTV